MRTEGWTVVRWVEFIVLALSAVAAVGESLQGSSVIAPRIAASLAIISKAIRTALAINGKPTSTVNPISWLIAVLLTIFVIVIPELVGGVAQ